MKRFLTLVLLGGVAGFSDPAHADVKAPSIFGDHMVLQCDVKTPIWGTADANEKITVKVAGQEKSSTADAKGDWRIVLDPIPAKVPTGANIPIEMTIAGKNKITITDVLVGEVWVCSGQSNMGFPMKSTSNAGSAIPAANRPTMRLFTVGRAIPDKPQREMTGKWEVCTPESVKEFSAVAYFFGSELQDNLKVPVGLIQPSWGGTRAEAWIPRETFDALKLPYEPAWTEEWLHPKPNPKSKEPVVVRPHEAPAVLYNGMIYPITGYAIRGAVWYQGETNTAYGEHYRKVLGALVTSWREAWGQGDFPFLIVQLPNFENTRFWPTLREAQAQVSRELPNVGMAVAIDVGNPKNIHPTNKVPVGHRLSLVAQKMVYGQDVPYSGPAFKSVKADGEKAVVRFDHIDGGLKAKGDALEGFELAGTDGKFVPAVAKIEGETVTLTADGVKSPKTVRYAWANNPKCTLYNAADLPAAPFEAKVK